MYRQCLIISVLVVFSQISNAQSMGIGTNTPHTSARLEIKSDKKGVLFPRTSTTGVQAINAPAKGLIAYDSVANELMINNGNSITPLWQPLSGESTSWSLTGNAGTNPSVNFIGTKDHERIAFRIRNVNSGFIDSVKNSTAFGFKADKNYMLGGNTSFGHSTFRSNFSGSDNVAFGHEALYTNTSGYKNIAFGAFALWVNDGGTRNVAVGNAAIAYATHGGNNTGVGYASLGGIRLETSSTGVGSRSLEYGDAINNSVLGYSAMRHNESGTYNVAFGSQAMENIYSCGFSAAAGAEALFNIYSGLQNDALGFRALYNTVDGQNNFGAGWNALVNNNDGHNNVAFGDAAQFTSTIGERNTAVGSGAYYYTSTGSQYNTMFGFHAGHVKNLGWNNTLIGAEANAKYDNLYNSIGVGMGAEIVVNNMGTFGNTYTNSIGGYRAWTNISDGRYKKDIKEDVKGLEFIMKLRPVTYRFNMTELQNRLNPDLLKKMDERMIQALADREKQIETGFIAQEVEQAATEIGYDFNGVVKPGNENDYYSLRYESFVMPLVKGMQEQQQQIEEIKNADSIQFKKLEDIKKRLLKQEQ